jgi:hypothetical protein
MFKVGDRGKTRDGRTYKVVLVDDHAMYPVVYSLDGRGTYTCTPAGVYDLTDCPDGKDLMPPDRAEATSAGMAWDLPVPVADPVADAIRIYAGVCDEFERAQAEFEQATNGLAVAASNLQLTREAIPKARAALKALL